jgi:hypothetical protein
MRKQIPAGPDDETCFRDGRPCSETCYANGRKCVLWSHFRGVDAVGQEVDGWYCANALMPSLLLEVAQQSRQGAAATESFRNEMVARADAQAHVLSLAALTTPQAKLIEVQHGP